MQVFSAGLEARLYGRQDACRYAAGILATMTAAGRSRRSRSL